MNPRISVLTFRPAWAAALSIIVAGCSHCANLPPLGPGRAKAACTVQSKPKAPAKVAFKATAYSFGSKCNGTWARRNAIGGRLHSGEVNSAAADWSKLPLGTKFRVVETGKVYEVDDYGSAMVGKDKVDLYMSDYGQVDRWGVRDVTLEVIEWGSSEKSLEVLKPRAVGRHGYVRRMVEGLEAKLGSLPFEAGRAG